MQCSRRSSALVALTLALWAILPSVATAQGYSAAVCAKGQGGITLSVQGPLIVLKGGICPGDDAKFVAFLAGVEPSIRTIKLISGGGNGAAAQSMGVVIHSQFALQDSQRLHAHLRLRREALLRWGGQHRDRTGLSPWAGLSLPELAAHRPDRR